MKVKAKNRKNFEPIDLTFTIESQEELEMFEELSTLKITIPRSLSDDNYENCKKFLLGLYQQLINNQGISKYSKIKKINMTTTKLQEVLSTDPMKLNNLSYYKSELLLISNDEFEQLRNHIKISDYTMHEFGIDTIVITNMIFKNSK